MNGNSKTVQCLSNGPSIWVDCQHPEGEHLCLVLRPVLMKTAWQSASWDNNAIKHWGTEGAGRREKERVEAPVTVKRHVTFQTLGVQRYIVPSMRTSNQHTPKQTGQQGFGSVETLLCEKIKPACCGKFASGLLFCFICTGRMWNGSKKQMSWESLCLIE